ncbi:acetyltransferase, GNAT family [Bacteriovorax sp. BSW11_IV]|uniref:GNAT family N-acetyltransferase n=1 Tax=Bacteriovorax sp. BSW11_IV TaxID=1353529 RepID=UPI00038A2467|nr:GNAT family N-acetyltransferase [Bacteriovorax sp. BSW11_IV]EQC44936.1 acetyltransferase, GNAT family [Bacteriovorax sp. BSW11_IV]
MRVNTERLILNSFRIEEAKLVAKMAGDVRVVEMTASIPYPYEPHMAVDWIKGHDKQKEEHNNHIFAIRLKESLELIGCINIGFNETHDRGYVGYWVGFDFWGKGYCTEALKEIIKYGFSFENVNKIWAEHKTKNIPSGKVMEKAGMTHEGIMRKHYKQNAGEYLDMSVKSILRSEFETKV